MRNKPLADLLGVRYLLQPRDAADQPDGHISASEPGWKRVLEDDDARSYSFTIGGVQPLPPYEVWENLDVLPRAFVVPRAAPLPDRPEVLDTLKTTDFRRTVLLEDWRDEFAAAAPAATYRAAEATDYRPNRVILHEEGSAGWLVLTDVWFPGWKCMVNGRPAEIHRADFLFRAVAVPDGPCDVVFTFEPESYLRGKGIKPGRRGAGRRPVPRRRREKVHSGERRGVSPPVTALPAGLRRAARPPSYLSRNSIGESRYRSFFQTGHSWPPESTWKMCGTFFSSRESWNDLLAFIRLSLSPQEIHSSRSFLTASAGFSMRSPCRPNRAEEKPPT